MSVLSTREETELRLKAELDEAARQSWDATPDELVDAKRRHRQALRAFTRLVMDGISSQE